MPTSKTRVLTRPFLSWLQGKKRRMGLVEPLLELPDDLTRDQIQKTLQEYLKQCVKWQKRLRTTNSHSRLAEEHRSKFGTHWLALTRVRAPVVIIAFLIALFVVTVGWLALSSHTDFPLQDWLKPNPVWSALLPLLIASPVAFAIWVFRDQNAQWQIDNQRKDINLKDFQKLCEWASGQHLLEDKSTESRKTISEKGATRSLVEKSSEVVRTTETTTLPSHASGVSRRVGGESLQIAAIYQLQAFMAGEFGSHFQRPTFQLYKSLWQALMGNLPTNAEEHWQAYLADDYASIDRSLLDAALSRWRRLVTKQAKSALGSALLQAFAVDSGAHLARHAHDLPGALFMGVNTRNPGLVPWQLAGFDLTGIQLQGANLEGARLQGAALIRAQLQSARLDGLNAQGANLVGALMQRASLSGAQLQGARMRLAKLQQAELLEADLRGADLSSAKLHWAELDSADLRVALLRNAQLQEASLQEAKLQNADLKFARLQGANLTNAALAGADLRGSSIDEETNLLGARYDSSTIFGRLKPSGSRTNNEDFIESEIEEQRWRERGARRSDE